MKQMSHSGKHPKKTSEHAPVNVHTPPGHDVYSPMGQMPQQNGLPMNMPPTNTDQASVDGEMD